MVKSVFFIMTLATAAADDESSLLQTHSRSSSDKKASLNVWDPIGECAETSSNDDGALSHLAGRSVKCCDLARLCTKRGARKMLKQMPELRTETQLNAAELTAQFKGTCRQTCCYSKVFRQAKSHKKTLAMGSEERQTYKTMQAVAQAQLNCKAAGPMRPDDAGDADGDEGGCAANTNVSAIICPGLKTLCVNGFFRSGTVTVKDVDVALKAVGGDDSIVQALSTPFEKFDLSTIDITMPSFKDTKSMFLAHKWAYGIVDPVSRDFNQTKFDILASFAKDGRIGLAELKQADETMFTEFRKDEAAGKIHGFNAEEMMVPSFAVAGYLEIFGEADPDTGLKSVKASELHDAYSSGKIPEDWEKASASMRSPTIGQAGKNMMARMQQPWPEQ